MFCDGMPLWSIARCQRSSSEAKPLCHISPMVKAFCSNRCGMPATWS